MTLAKMSRIHIPRGLQIRWFSAKEKLRVINSVDQLLDNKEMKHRKHPGKTQTPTLEFPKWALDRFEIMIHDEQIDKKQLFQNAIKLKNHLRGRHVPSEEHDIDQKREEVSLILSDKLKNRKINTEAKEKKTNKLAKKILKQHVYNWTQLDYNKFGCMTYFAARAIQNYYVLSKVLNEIAWQEPDFKPETLFDFGSGIGTVTWVASQYWPKSLKEYVCIDSSGDMNTFAEQLLNDATPSVKNVYYRQFFPAASIPAYDIVVSAYSLLELPDRKSRLQTIGKLWRKTNKYLVIVEEGTNAGFKIVEEARDFVLHYVNMEKRPIPGHVVSPCPHDLSCPRFQTDDTPCNFQISYLTSPIFGAQNRFMERYSYVILKKGNRPEDDVKWPRIVRPTLKRSRHVICRTCTPSGELKEEIFTAYKNGKNTYRCARVCDWGDRLPFEFTKPESE